jgi:hypothetical protein
VDNYRNQAIEQAIRVIARKLRAVSSWRVALRRSCLSLLIQQSTRWRSLERCNAASDNRSAIAVKPPQVREQHSGGDVQEVAASNGAGEHPIGRPAPEVDARQAGRGPARGDRLECGGERVAQGREVGDLRLGEAVVAAGDECDREIGQHIGVDAVVAEQRLVLRQTQAAQPSRHIHGSALRLSGCRVSV